MELAENDDRSVVVQIWTSAGKRLIMLALVGLMLVGCSAKYTESWFGPSSKATPVCGQTQPGLGFVVGDQEFIAVGYYTWTDVRQNEHRERVYVLRPKAGGAK